MKRKEGTESGYKDCVAAPAQSCHEVDEMQHEA